MENLLFLLILVPSLSFLKHSFVSKTKICSKINKEEVDLLDSKDEEDIDFYYSFLYW